MKKKLKKAKKKKILQLKFSFMGFFIGFFLTSAVAVFFINMPRQIEEINCANSISCINDLSGVPEDNAGEAIFLGQQIIPPQVQIQQYLASNSQAVLGENSSNKKILVDLSQQKLYAREGDATVYEFSISSGKPWWATPVGTYRIWIKLRATRMSGGSKEKGTYYNLPNVQYTMYYYNDQIPKYKGFGIHGAYWHNNFGHPMSHGCINMRNEDAEKLYNWAAPVSTGHSTKATAENPGTIVEIFGTTPKE